MSPKPPDRRVAQSALEPWAGVECSRVRVGRRIVDQLSLTGHDQRPNDLDLIATLGVRAVRYPVPWERVAPRGLANANWRWADRRLGRLRSLGVRPVVGLLHHGYGPPGMSLLHPGFPQAFARYARAVAERYPWVTEYLPINEPLTTARFTGLYGFWYPHQRSEPTFARLLLAQCLAIREASRAIRRVNPAAQIIVNEDVGRTFSTAPLQTDADYLNERRWVAWDVLLGRVGPGHAMHSLFTSTRENAARLAELTANPSPPDILGVDHYVTSDRFLDHRVSMYPPSRRDPMVPGFVDVEACRVPDVPVASIARAIDDTWARYRLAMILSEVALAGEPQDQVAWWWEAWHAAQKARENRIDIRSVTAWSVFGSVDWHCLLRRSEGVYAPGVFDVTTTPPVRRPVADAIALAAQPNRRRHVGQEGWWVRPDRFMVSA